MKALILAGGFAKRMGELGKGIPKSLLNIAGKPVIEHILEKLEAVTDIENIFISTNKKFEENFVDWMGKLNTPMNIELVIEPAMEEGQKLGSIGAIKYLVDQKDIDEELLVINGDNVFECDLQSIVDFYKEKKTFVFGVYDTRNIEEAKKMGVVLVDQNGTVIDFEEKPKKPKSTTVSTGIYIFQMETLMLINNYIESGKSPDRLGDFLAWLMKSQKIYAYVFKDKWFDIGTPETYEQADKELSKDNQ